VEEEDARCDGTPVHVRPAVCALEDGSHGEGCDETAHGEGDVEGCDKSGSGLDAEERLVRVLHCLQVKIALQLIKRLEGHHAEVVGLQQHQKEPRRRMRGRHRGGSWGGRVLALAFERGRGERGGGERGKGQRGAVSAPLGGLELSGEHRPHRSAEGRPRKARPH